jgi:hypothetical protein
MSFNKKVNLMFLDNLSSNSKSHESEHVKMKKHHRNESKNPFMRREEPRMSKDTSRGASQVPGILLGTADLEDGPGLTYLDRGKATMRIDDSTIVGGTIEYDDKYFNEFIGSGRATMKNKKSPRSPLPPIQLQSSPSNNYLFNMRHLNSTIPVPDKSDVLTKN